MNTIAPFAKVRLRWLGGTGAVNDEFVVTLECHHKAFSVKTHHCCTCCSLDLSQSCSQWSSVIFQELQTNSISMCAQPWLLACMHSVWESPVNLLFGRQHFADGKRWKLPAMMNVSLPMAADSQLARIVLQWNLMAIQWASSPWAQAVEDLPKFG